MAESGILIVDLIDGVWQKEPEKPEVPPETAEDTTTSEHQHPQGDNNKLIESLRRHKTPIRIITAILAIVIWILDLVGDVIGLGGMGHIRRNFTSGRIGCNKSITTRLIVEQEVWTPECFLKTKNVGHVGVYTFLIVIVAILFFFEIYGIQWTIKQHKNAESDPKDVITRPLVLTIMKLLIQGIALNVLRLEYGLIQYPDGDKNNPIVISAAIYITTAPLKCINYMFFYQELRRVYKWKKALYTRYKGPYWNAVPNVKHTCDKDHEDKPKKKKKAKTTKEEGQDKKKKKTRALTQKEKSEILRWFLLILLIASLAVAIATVVIVPLDNSKRLADM